MPVFKDSDQLYECIGGLFDILKKDDKIGPKIKASGLIIRFKYGFTYIISLIEYTSNCAK